MFFFSKTRQCNVESGNARWHRHRQDNWKFVTAWTELRTISRQNFIFSFFTISQDHCKKTLNSFNRRHALPCEWSLCRHWCRPQTKWSGWRKVLRSSVRTGKAQSVHWSTAEGLSWFVLSTHTERDWLSWSSPWLVGWGVSHQGTSCQTRCKKRRKQHF